MKRTWRDRLADWWEAKARNMEIRAAKRALRSGVPIRAIAEDAPTLTYDKIVKIKDEMWANGWENP